MVKRYDRYLTVQHDCYKFFLEKAYALGQLEAPYKIGDYAEFLQGLIFSLSIQYKLKSREELREFIDEET